MEIEGGAEIYVSDDFSVCDHDGRVTAPHEERARPKQAAAGPENLAVLA
jgi:hypothetical protein